MADITSSLAGLPIEDLICGPILAVARGQAALCEVYVNYIMRLAYDQSGQGGNKVRLLTFSLERPVTDGQGNLSSQTITVNAPLLSLVPVPAFTMSEATVRFTMEVHTQETSKEETTKEGSFEAGYSGWGLHCSVTGKVTNHSENTRSTDNSAKYDIYARASQQPPAEGMSRLCQVFASAIEPINTGGGK